MPGTPGLAPALPHMAAATHPEARQALSHPPLGIAGPPDGSLNFKKKKNL